MRDEERWNLALRAHAAAHHAMHERGLGRHSMPVLARELSYAPQHQHLAGLGADYRCTDCTPITEETFPWGIALGSALAGAALVWVAGSMGYIKVG